MRGLNRGNIARLADHTQLTNFARTIRTNLAHWFLGIRIADTTRLNIFQPGNRRRQIIQFILRQSEQRKRIAQRRFGPHARQPPQRGRGIMDRRWKLPHKVISETLGLVAWSVGVSGRQLVIDDASLGPVTAPESDLAS